MFESLENILKRRFNSLNLEGMGLAEKIFERWYNISPKIFGEEILNKVKPILFQRGRLVIQVSDSVIACELQSKKENIISLLNKGFVKKQVKDISLKL